MSGKKVNRMLTPRSNLFSSLGMHSPSFFALGFAFAFAFALGFGISCAQAEETSESKSQATETSGNRLTLRHHAIPEELARWIEQLGASEFRIREKATLELSKCDSTAVETLRQAANETSDAEVTSRCLAIAESIYRSDVGKRTQAFLKSVDPKESFGFNGWLPFSQIVGDGRVSKRLFVQVIESHPMLANSGQESAAELDSLVQKLTSDVWIKIRTGRPFEIGDAVSILYFSIRLEGKVPDEVARTSLLLLRQYPFTSEIRRAHLRSSLRKLSGRWMEVTKADPAQILRIAIESDIPESLAVSRNALSDPNCDPSLFVVANAALMRYGNEDDLPLLARWREEVRLLREPIEISIEVPQPMSVPNGPPNIPPNVPDDKKPRIEKGPLLFRPQTLQERRVFELRYQDLALAASAKLSGREDLRELFPRIQIHMNYVFVPESLAFPQGESEGRQKVIDLFRAK